MVPKAEQKQRIRIINQHLLLSPRVSGSITLYAQLIFADQSITYSPSNNVAATNRQMQLHVHAVSIVIDRTAYANYCAYYLKALPPSYRLHHHCFNTAQSNPTSE